MAASTPLVKQDHAVISGKTTIAKPKIGTAELLFRAALKMDLNPEWIVANGLFVVLINGKEQYINFARSPLNSNTNVSLAEDKYLTRRILERHGLRNIPFIRPMSQTEAAAFLDVHTKIIAKPVRGSGSRDIHVITEPEQLQALKVSSYILERYVAGQELRYLVLDGEIISVHRSDYGISVQEDRLLERISFDASAWDPALVTSALNIAQVLGLKFAAVDYIIDASGCAYILEVNTRPGLKWFHAPTSGPVVDVAHQFLKAIVKNVEKVHS